MLPMFAVWHISFIPTEYRPLAYAFDLKWWLALHNHRPDAVGSVIAVVAVPIQAVEKTQPPIVFADFKRLRSPSDFAMFP